MPDENTPWMAGDLKAWRARMGMTQAAAAEAFGVHVHALKNWEGGRRPIAAIVRRLAVALERERQTAVDTAVMEAAWNYLNTVAASSREWSRTGRLSERHTQPVADAVQELRAVVDGPRASALVTIRAQWLSRMAAAEVRKVEADNAGMKTSAVLPEPLAVDARHASLSEVAQTILVGGNSTGISLNSIPLLLDAYVVEDGE